MEQNTSINIILQMILGITKGKNIGPECLNFGTHEVDDRGGIDFDTRNTRYLSAHNGKVADRANKGPLQVKLDFMEPRMVQNMIGQK